MYVTQIAVAVLVILLAVWYLSRRPQEGFALDLSPRGGYPNCKGCVIEPPLEESSTWQPSLYDGAQGMGISTTMSGTVFRDWQTLHGNNMKGRTIHSNNISIELDNDKKMYDYLTNPYNYPRYAVAASPDLRPLNVSGCDYCHNSAQGCIKCRIHYGEDKAVVGTGMSKDYYYRVLHGN